MVMQRARNRRVERLREPHEGNDAASPVDALDLLRRCAYRSEEGREIITLDRLIQDIESQQRRRHHVEVRDLELVREHALPFRDDRRRRLRSEDFDACRTSVQESEEDQQYAHSTNRTICATSVQ